MVNFSKKAKKSPYLGGKPIYTKEPVVEVDGVKRERTLVQYNSATDGISADDSFNFDEYDYELD